MASATPPARRRARWVALGVIVLLVVVGVTALLTALLFRPEPPATSSAPAATPAPVATPTPAPEATPGGAAADQAEQHERYRAYVSSVVEGSTAVVAGLLGLAGCRTSRAVCVDRLGAASDQVNSMQQDLTANPAPACLSSADQRLQDALGFQQKGLDIARDAVRTQDRVQLAQGLLLTTVGVWRGTQAIVDGRQANC
jgi:hypothetical protein